MNSKLIELDEKIGEITGIIRGVDQLIYSFNLMDKMESARKLTEMKTELNETLKITIDEILQQYADFVEKEAA